MLTYVIFSNPHLYKSFHMQLAHCEATQAALQVTALMIALITALMAALIIAAASLKKAYSRAYKQTEYAKELVLCRRHLSSHQKLLEYQAQ